MRRALVALALTACGNPYYQPCEEGCRAGYLCADPGRIDVCTVTCGVAADCAGLGARSFCAIGGVCLEPCTSDPDCPITSYCDRAEGVCVR
jgi:hypothetical protein